MVRRERDGPRVGIAGTGPGDHLAAIARYPETVADLL